MTRHYPDLGSDSDWLKCEGISFQPIRSTTKIWVVTRHQYGFSALVTQTSFCEGSCGDLARRRMSFSGYWNASWPYFALKTAALFLQKLKKVYFFQVSTLFQPIGAKMKPARQWIFIYFCSVLRMPRFNRPFFANFTFINLTLHTHRSPLSHCSMNSLQPDRGTP